MLISISKQFPIRMGKDKELKSEAPGIAFSRMNYLYQAAQLTAKLPKSNPLSNYYNKIMKEISKKVLEKLHPDLKRTVCCACNYPLAGDCNQANIKIKPHRKRKRKKKLSTGEGNKEFCVIKSSNGDSGCKYSKNRVEVRNIRPNKVWWSCSKCHYSKGFLQKPSKKLWIHEVENAA